MKKWIVKYRENGSDRIRTTSHTGNKTRQEVIDFFGLNESDIDWYEITLEE